MMNTLKKINQSLEKIGRGASELILRCLVVILLIIPGGIFTYFLAVLIDSEMSLTLIPAIKLFILGIASWYLGRGLSTNIKDPVSVVTNH